MTILDNALDEDDVNTLRINCQECSGLCCVALYCMKSDGFPENKEAGVPCTHLMKDFRCEIHSSLLRKRLKGCLAYDCFGAGQKVTQVCVPNENWKSNPEKANEIFRVFQIVYQLHQMAWYLVEALSLISDEKILAEVRELVVLNRKMAAYGSKELMALNLEEYKSRVNRILRQVARGAGASCIEELDCKDFFGKNFRKATLDGKDFSMAMLIGANLEGCSLKKTNFLGADIRDAKIKGTDLSSCIFLTQMQLNSAKGNFATKIPSKLLRPSSWEWDENE